MNTLKRVLIIGCFMALLLPASGCSEEGSMESAGKKMDQMVQDAEDSVNDALSNAKRQLGFHEPGPAEKLLGENGRNIDAFIRDTEKYVDELVVSAKKFLTDVR